MNDQLCYEVDLNKFSDKNNIRNELKLGLNFLIDYNEDKQVTFEQNISRKELGLANNLVASDQDQHASVYLDSIGRNYKGFQNKKWETKIAEEVKLIGEGEYNFNVLKQIRVTESYLGLDQDVRGCQNDEPYDNCTTRHYLNTMLGECGCISFNTRRYKKVLNSIGDTQKMI